MINIKAPCIEDESAFISAVKSSQYLHSPWVKAPSNAEEFKAYLERSQLTNHKSFLVIDEYNNIVGVFNINEIIRGAFQSAFLGYYAMIGFEGKGYMSMGLKLVLKKAFNELKLHRLEANIQPENDISIRLVKNNGFRYEGYSPNYLNINGKWRDHERWAITLEDYIQVKTHS